MKPLERLGEARTPKGTVIALYRHDGAYLLRADGVELMSTRRHHSEDRLAQLACAPFRATPRARVLIGGLGLGFTLRAALSELAPDAEVVVAELLAEVIAWNANPAYELSVEALADGRVRMVQDDVIRVLRAEEARMRPRGETAERGDAPGFDAIMLDTDNGPEGMLMSESASLYSLGGIATTIGALRPGGILAYWSVGDDVKFVKTLRHAGLQVETEVVRAHRTSGPMHSLYIAHKRSPGQATRTSS